MLRQAEYHCNGWGLEGMPEYNKLVYSIIGHDCYFSGIESEKRTSTINAAENIILEIARRENFNFHGYRFYDLQTQKGYDYFLPGYYEFNELILVKNAYGMHITSWIRSELPKDVYEIFKDYIGIDLKTIYKEVFGKSNGLISVMDKEGKFLFVRPDGTPAFKELYFDLTDFQNGLAWVCVGNDEWQRINTLGVAMGGLRKGRELS